MKLPPVCRRLVAAMILIPAACLGCLQADDPGDRRHYGLFIGISDYQVSRFNLNYADDDAAAMAGALSRSPTWDRGRIKVLLNGAATKEAIRRAIDDIAARMDDNDYFLFYFSGHGTFGPDLRPYDEADGLDEYLVPHDALQGSYDNDIRDDELADWLEAVPGSRLAVVLDSSFSGGMTKNLQAAKGIVRWDLGRGVRQGDGLTKDISRGGSIILTASDDHESPLETSTLGHGVYTYFLLQGIEGPADADGNGDLAAEEVHEYAAPRSTSFYAGMHPQITDRYPGDYHLMRLP